MEVKELKIEDLLPYKNNPRKNDKAVQAVANSIQRFGFLQPIVLDGNNVVVAGHTRLKAAKQLGMKTVPCVYVEDLTEEEVNAYRLADNKTNELAEWDSELLGVELDQLTNIDMSAFGFEMPEEEPAVEEDEFIADVENIEARVKPGDLWKLGRHRLMCGDSTLIDNVEKLVGGGYNRPSPHGSSIQCCV